ncbi:tyrosine-type recombinase/integrase [Aquabacterium sp.]|uniref:tyrosine-type recombinase/integrase n=1 Tax=Aquabacterium sp. TaxID=1872578 RepID=UPI002BD78EA3|nr:tyrosine-type recombinase/integrase [Aquabacterium sp.]HSW06096.1 tyrosine-type recombinase/integrase [Aquabacterium sp.]
MSTQQRPTTDRELKAWLASGAVDRGVGEGLTFVASTTAAQAGKASWVLRYRLNGHAKEKVLGRYPELSLKDAREQARQDRAQVERGIDVAAAKQAEKALVLQVPTVQRLGEVWFARYIQPRYKHPEVVARVLRKHINPVLGSVAPSHVQPAHIDQVLARIVAGGAPTVANDALRYMSRMFRMAVRNHWIDRNPAADFDLIDAGGDEMSRDRWLTSEELQQLARSMRTTPNFGRENELAVWLLLALCVRKMELLSARWDAFDLDAGVWTLARESTKTRSAIRIPLTEPVIVWLKEARVFSFGKPYIFPARRLVRRRLGEARGNRFEHVGPDTLNVALKRLKVLGIEHFTVHDMRRTARTHLAGLGVDRFVAERSLNHKLGNVEGIYNRHDYFAERNAALGAWAALLAQIEHRAKEQALGPQCKNEGRFQHHPARCAR